MGAGIPTVLRFALAANLRQFRGDLDARVKRPSDRERCRQLLANMEFVIDQGVPRGSPLHSWVFRWIWLSLVAIFPVAVLLVVQARALRYQSGAVLSAERVAIIGDLLLLVWFFHRRWLVEARGRVSDVARLRLWVALLLAPVAVVAVNFAWLNILGAGAPSATIEGQTYYDRIACGLSSGWGCRFLRLDHRTLVGHVWRGEAIADLRAAKGDTSAALAAVEGLFLRSRALRFADFSESRLYNADLIGTDLSGAHLAGADLSNTNLSGARLGGADLNGARLRGAYLAGADLNGAHLRGTSLSGASLYDAHLAGADLHGADLSDAYLGGAHLAGADLAGAHLSGADLHGADLRGANLESSRLSNADLGFADLSGADLSDADLPGAHLSGADLHGADLSSADLSSAHLRGTFLSGAHLHHANLSGADLSYTDLAGTSLSQSQLDAACGTNVKTSSYLNPSYG